MKAVLRGSGGQDFFLYCFTLQKILYTKNVCSEAHTFSINNDQVQKKSSISSLRPFAALTNPQNNSTNP